MTRSLDERTPPPTANRPSSSVPAHLRLSAWLALALLALALLMVGFMFATAVLPGHEQLATSVDGIGDLLTIVPSLAAFVTLPAVGAVLAILRPGNPVGWILLVGGLALVLGDFSLAYVERSILVRPALPGHRLLDWLAPVFSTVAFPLLTIWLPLLFPDGRLPGPRWRVVGLLAVANMALAVLAALFTTVEGEWGRAFPNPTAWGGDAWTVVTGVTYAISAALIVAAIVAVLVRFRASRGVERQQMKWFLATVVLVAAAMFTLAAQTTEWAWGLLMLAIALVAIAIGIAVLRYRLYEIDRLISRTIGWAIVTGIVVAVFAGGVIALQAVLAGFTQGETLAVAASTLLAFALFMPLRTRVQRAVDRRFDRARYDGERLLGGFGDRLRDEVDRDAIRADVLGTVDAAVRPASVGLWLREGAGER